MSWYLYDSISVTHWYTKLTVQSVSSKKCAWKKEPCYTRLMQQLYQSIDSIHGHSKLYSEFIYYYGYISNHVIVVKRVIIIYGRGVDHSSWQVWWPLTREEGDSNFCRWKKDPCYPRLMQQHYKSIDSIHDHSKLYSEFIYYHGYRSNSCQKGDYYLLEGGWSLIMTGMVTIDPGGSNFCRGKRGC